MYCVLSVVGDAVDPIAGGLPDQALVHGLSHHCLALVVRLQHLLVLTVSLRQGLQQLEVLLGFCGQFGVRLHVEVLVLIELAARIYHADRYFSFLVPWQGSHSAVVLQQALEDDTGHAGLAFELAQRGLFADRVVKVLNQLGLVGDVVDWDSEGLCHIIWVLRDLTLPLGHLISFFFLCFIRHLVVKLGYELGRRHRVGLRLVRLRVNGSVLRHEHWGHLHVAVLELVMFRVRHVARRHHLVSKRNELSIGVVGI